MKHYPVLTFIQLSSGSEFDRTKNSSVVEIASSDFKNLIRSSSFPMHCGVSSFESKL